MKPELCSRTAPTLAGACVSWYEGVGQRSLTVPNAGLQRLLPKAVRCNDGLGVIGLALGLHPSYIGKHDRGFDLPRWDRPVCPEQAILIYVRDDCEAVSSIELNGP